MREAAKRREPSTYRGGGTDPALLSELRRREWARRSPEEKQSHLAAFIEAGQKNNKKNQKTSIEGVVRTILSELGVSFEQNQQLGRYNVEDARRQAALESRGYRFFYLWESEIQHNTDEVRKRLIGILGAKYETD
jgi:hypothetical protein